MPTVCIAGSRGILAVAVAALAFAGLPAQRAYAATTITVTTNADELNTDGDCSLREAVQAANTDAAVDDCARGDGADTIRLAATTYVIATGAVEDGNAAGDLDVVEDLSIVGAGMGRTAISGAQEDGALHVPVFGVRLSLSSLDVNDGHRVFGAGGGVSSLGPVTLSRVAVRRNRASDGAGVYAFGLTMTDSVLSTNITHSGGKGGGLFLAFGTSRIERSTVQGNYVDGEGSQGSGIYLTQGDLTVVDSAFTGNGRDAGGGQGGAIFSNSSRLTLDRSTFARNTANHGGAVYVHSGVALIRNTTITDNTAHESQTAAASGGAIYSTGTMDLLNVTIARNGARFASAGQIYNFGRAESRSTIIAHTTAGDGGCSGFQITSRGNNLEYLADDYSCFSPDPSNRSGDPRLGPLASNGGRTATLALGAGSAAVNAGAGCIATDQRGAPRRSGACDIGAYEQVTCLGGLVNVVGSDASERITGTPGNDVIATFNGDDTVDGAGGDDRICTGIGNDLLVGGPGDDRLAGEAGNDRYVPGADNDTVSDSSGLDRVDFSASTVGVTVDLGSSPGTAAGQGVDGLTGVEEVIGTRFTDTLRGSAVANLLSGLGSRDFLYGRAGNDRLLGGDGNDDLFGEGDDDSLDGGAGTDLCAQGAGTGSRTACER